MGLSADTSACQSLSFLLLSLPGPWSPFLSCGTLKWSHEAQRAVAFADLLLKKTIGSKEETGFTEESTKNPIVFQPPSQAFPGDPVSVGSGPSTFSRLGREGWGSVVTFKALDTKPSSQVWNERAREHHCCA